MAIANYQRKWDYLSKDHQEIDEDSKKAFKKYLDDLPLKYMAYAVLGTFGVGKTQFLFHLHQRALDMGIIPLYFIAEDLFKEIIANDKRVWTAGELYSLIEKKTKEAIDELKNGKVDSFRSLLDPRGKITNDTPAILDTVIQKFSKAVPEIPKFVMLVDELEGQYGNLQNIVQTRDRSPLREWLESKTHLKYLAFAPAGIYELGGADRDRVQRIVIPSADIMYIRNNLVSKAGKANSCWWLARGKSRQLYRTVDTLTKLNSDDFNDTAKASRLIKEKLDPIGQPPTEVPPAVIEKIKPSSIPYLLNIEPISTNKARRYIIDAKKLSTGELAERLTEAFSVNKDNAILISEYFKKTVLTLTDAEWVAYIEEKDLSELLCLTLDHFLEYEHGNPELAKTFGDLLSLYEKSYDDQASMHGTIGTLWERKETTNGLLLSIQEIRGAFPFPTMNPIIKDFIPDDMREKWIGRGLPIWIWSDNGITSMFFAAARDLESYFETDEFQSLAIPDGKGILCILPYGENIQAIQKNPLFKWLEKNNKLKVVNIQQLLRDFLLSASGELNEIPGNLKDTLNSSKNEEDVLHSRKIEIYNNAFNDTVRDHMIKPISIFKGNPPDADTVWGKNQIGYRPIAVQGIALAFANLKQDEKVLLAELRELFKGGREGKGVGDLRYLISGREPPGKGGHTRLPDRLLPYNSKHAAVKNTDIVDKLRSYWTDGELKNLEDLAHILPLDKFMKLSQDEDFTRLLEAVWRSIREEFGDDSIKGYITKLENSIVPTLQSCQGLENAGWEFGLEGIDFGNYEKIVKAKQGYVKLLEISKKSLKCNPLVRSIFNTLLESLNDIDNDIRTLAEESRRTQKTLTDLKISADNLKKNYWEYKKAVKYFAIKEEEVSQLLKEQLKMEGKANMSDLEDSANEKKDKLDSFSGGLSNLEGKLNELDKIFNSVKGEN